MIKLETHIEQKKEKEKKNKCCVFSLVSLQNILKPQRYKSQSNRKKINRKRI